MISPKPWSVEAVARLFLGIISSLCFAMFLSSILYAAKLHWSNEQRDFALMALTGVFFELSGLGWIALFLHTERMTWREAFGLESAKRVRAVVWGVVASLIFLPVALALQTSCTLGIKWLHEAKGIAGLQHHAEPQEAIKELQKPDLPIAEKLILGVMAIVVAPLAEETMFRGILYPTIKQAGYPRAAVLATSLIFGLIHNNMPSFVPLVLFSMLLIYLYEKTDSLLAPIAAHSCFNIVNFVLTLLAIPADTLLHTAK